MNEKGEVGSAEPATNGGKLNCGEAVAIEKVLVTLLGMIVSVTIFSMMALTFIDVLGRYFFNSPIPASYEITQLALATAVFAALPLVTLCDEHVTVSLLDPLFKGKSALLKDLAVGTISVVALIGFAWRLFVQAQILGSYGDSTPFLKIPFAPICYFMMAMCALSALLTVILLYLRLGKKTT